MAGFNPLTGNRLDAFGNEIDGQGNPVISQSKAQFQLPPPVQTPTPEVAPAQPVRTSPLGESAPPMPVRNQPLGEVAPPQLTPKQVIQARTAPKTPESTPNEPTDPLADLPGLDKAPIQEQMAGEREALEAQKAALAKQYDPETQRLTGQATTLEGIFKGNAAMQGLTFGHDTKQQAEAIGTQWAGNREALKARTVEGQGEAEQAKLAQQQAGLRAKEQKALMGLQLDQNTLTKGAIEVNAARRKENFGTTPVSPTNINIIKQATGQDVSNLTYEEVERLLPGVIEKIATNKVAVDGSMRLQNDAQSFQAQQNALNRSSSLQETQLKDQRDADRKREDKFQEDKAVKAWAQGGRAKVEGAIGQLEGIINEIGGSSKIGNLVDRGVNAVGISTPDLAARRQQILGVIVPVLKESFGGNPSNAEREALGQMLYDPRVSKEANIAAITNYMKGLQQKADSMDNYINAGAKRAGLVSPQSGQQAKQTSKFDWES